MKRVVKMMTALRAWSVVLMAVVVISIFLMTPPPPPPPPPEEHFHGRYIGRHVSIHKNGCGHTCHRIYSRTSVAPTLMARLPRLFQTRS